MKNEEYIKLICDCGKKHYMYIRPEKNDLMFKINFSYSKTKTAFDKEIWNLDDNDVKKEIIKPDFKVIDSNTLDSASKI